MLEEMLPFIGIPIAFLVFFVISRYVIPNLGGWKHLAKHYATSEEANTMMGEHLRIPVVKVGGLNLKNIVRFYKTNRGLFLSQRSFFRGNQPNLMIPWSAFGRVTHKKQFFTKQVHLEIGTPAISYLEMREKDFLLFKDRLPKGR
ncbi:MAG: hypothetical protein DA408_18845 [Bacteroidetes bacterium]|nr:MAG: hypothetical protein C7N36_08935 [Bacteroidota bacterium]PTM09220.1 MAG: hypothetical protein DA408_18845 [Bacteroidota bacterium]